MRLDIEQIFQERFNHFYLEASRYWRLMASSGLLFTVSVLVIMGAIYYRDFLAWIPEAFPIPLALAVLFSVLVTRASHRTFLKEADLLFLTTVESRMESYFQKAWWYNFIVQGAGVFAVLVILAPLYMNKIPTEHQQLLFYFAIPLLLKGWNLHSNWTVLRIQDNRQVNYHHGLRFALNTLFLLWFFEGGPVTMLIGFSIAFLLFYMYERKLRQEHAIHWLYLVDMENRLQSRFYRFVNAFVDVPHLQSKVKRRGWITFLSNWLPFHSSQTYRYLYVKTFFRANEYFGIYLRLTIIGALVVTFIPDEYGKAVAYVFFLFLTSMQVKSLWGHHSRQMWLSIIPLPKRHQKEAFIWFMFYLLLLQALIMFIPVIYADLEFWKTLVLPIVGVIYAYGYSYVILNRKLSKK